MPHPLKFHHETAAIQPISHIFFQFSCCLHPICSELLNPSRSLGLWPDVEAVSRGREVREGSPCLQGRCGHGSRCRLPADTATEPLTFPEGTWWERGIQATGQTVYSGGSCGEAGAQQQGLSLQNPRTTPRSALLDMKERVGSVGQPYL